MFTKSEKILLSILAALQFSHIVDFMIMMPLGPQLMRIFNINAHEFSLLVSSYLFSGTISGILSALFVDKFDRKKVLLIFYVGFAVGTLGCALAPNYWILLSTRTLAGFFGGVLASMVMSIVSDGIAVEKRATAMGLVMASFSVASVFGVPFSLYLATHIDWHAPFVFLGVVSLILSVFIFFILPPMKDHLRGPHESKGRFEAWVHISRDPNQLRALAFMSMLMLGQFTIIPFLSPSFVANAGMQESELPLIYLTGGVISMIVSPTVGRLADKFGKKQIGSIGLLLSLIPIYLVTHLGRMPVFEVLIFSGSFFLVMGARMVPAVALTSTVVTPKYRGSFMSVSSSVQSLSNAIASYVAGLIVVKEADGSLSNYGTVGWMAMGFSLIAFFLLQGIRSVEHEHSHPHKAGEHVGGH